MGRLTIKMVPVLALAVALLPPASATAATSSFASTGAEQTFTVPAGVTSIRVVAVGGRGGITASAFGARVTGDLAVTPGQVLFIEVGGNGSVATASETAGGFNGGGVGKYLAGTGGGASDVRTASASQGGSLSSRLIVAGGGGGGYGDGGVYGGQGGAAGSPGADGVGVQHGNGGGAGTAVSSGAGGSPAGVSGTPGVGGAGGGTGTNAKGGGGGGGGYYGGGGGGAGTGEYNGGGGGGGSSFTGTATNASVVTDTSGTPSIVLTYTGESTGQGGTNGTPGTTLPHGVADTTKPALGSLSFSATTFKAASSGGAFSAQKKRKKSAPTGTQVSFNLSEASAVKFTVQRKTSGRRVSRKCKTRTRKNHRKPKCTLWKNVAGSFTVPGKAGKNTFTFRGRIGGRKLRTGSYRLKGTATDPARNASVPKQKAFKIVK